MTLHEMMYLENKKYSESKISKKKVVKEDFLGDIESSRKSDEDLISRYVGTNTWFKCTWYNPLSRRTVTSWLMFYKETPKRYYVHSVSGSEKDLRKWVDKYLGDRMTYQQTVSKEYVNLIHPIEKVEI